MRNSKDGSYGPGPHAGKKLVSHATAKKIEASQKAAVERRGSPAGAHKYKVKGEIMD